MRGETKTYFGSDARYRAFTAVKYLTYLLLAFNIYWFFKEEITALNYTFAGDLEFDQIIQAFASTVDTGAWVLLLLLFELETSALDDAKITGTVKWTLHGIRGICYIAIGYAFTGYYAELVSLYNTTALAQADFCTWTDQGHSLLMKLDEYAPLDAANCASLATGAHRIEDFGVLAGTEALGAARWLAWTDVINAAAWILVVIVLEVEVRLQLRGQLSRQFMDASKVVKYALYGTLFAAAGYWGYAGDFIDVWDASLWLFAFIFIELNVFEWQHETSQQQAPPTQG